MKDTNKIFYLVLFVLALAVNFSGLNIDFFTDDPGLYASVAKRMHYKSDFFQLFTYNQDWLDKPHFPFWMIALSFKLFGVSVWAYRLPALLFFMSSVIYTWLFARRYYGWEAAATAVLILMTAQHVLLSNTDVRAEPYLMGLIIASVYHIARLEERFSPAQLLLAALLTACAIMTKGLFVIVAIYGSLLGQLLIQRKFNQVFQFKWLLLLVLTFTFTLPELYALYIQFDLHPEKTVFGAHHVSGIKWFLWDSQFGRFINNGPISRKAAGSIFFYLHTLLWAFAPWCLLFYYAIFKQLKAIWRKQKLEEYYTLCGGVSLLLLFSLSRFQLPFYTNAVFPLFAIVTAPLCVKQLSKLEERFRLAAQLIFVISLPLVVIIINCFLKPANTMAFTVDCVLFGMIAIIIFIKVNEQKKRAFFLTCNAALFTGLYLNTVFYSEIVPYRGQIAAADYVNQKPFEGFNLYSLKAGNNIFQFYSHKPVELASLDSVGNLKSKNPSIFYADQQSMDYLIQHHVDFKLIKEFLNYPQENILPSFIDKANRHKVLDHVYLITK
jgi:4-amino-4-deoxy-L-arabinose transferase-like glycosyltransferase